jgi:hypothetical protein
MVNHFPMQSNFYTGPRSYKAVRVFSGIVVAGSPRLVKILSLDVTDSNTVTAFGRDGKFYSQRRSLVLYQLSYSPAHTGPAGLEPATTALALR